MFMTKEQIYNSLNPSWWQVSTPNNWQTQFVSSVIVFDTAGTKGCTYISSAPIQTGGLYAGNDAPNSELATTIDILRTEASQRLFDMHCTNVSGNQDLTSVFNATS